jgi:hypothetical protein
LQSKGSKEQKTCKSKRTNGVFRRRRWIKGKRGRYVLNWDWCPIKVDNINNNESIHGESIPAPRIYANGVEKSEEDLPVLKRYKEQELEGETEKVYFSL